MAWNTNTITEPLIAAGAAVAVVAITFITALIDDFRRYHSISDGIQTAWRRVSCVDVPFFAFCGGLWTLCYRNPTLVPDWGGGLSAAIVSALLGSVIVFVAERIASYATERDNVYGFRMMRILVDEHPSLRLLRSHLFRLVLLVVVLSPVLAPFLGNIADAAPIGTETVTCFDAVLERAEKACAACFVPVFVEMIVALNAMMVLSWRRIDGYEEDWGPYRTREKMQGMYRSEMRRWFGLLNGRDEPLDVIPRRLDADLTAAENEGRDVDQLATMLCSYDPYRHVGRRRFVLASPGGDDARRRFAEHLRAKRSVLVRHGVKDTTIRLIAEDDGWFLCTIAGVDMPDHYSKWYRSLKDEGLLS